MTNKEQVFDLIQGHPEGLDDDAISELTGIKPRAQIQQLCNQLAATRRIRRESVEKTGKRRKIHNFPTDRVSGAGISQDFKAGWRKRLSALVAATGKPEAELLDEALEMLALKVLKNASADI
jgi:hypothetical protein